MCDYKIIQAAVLLLFCIGIQQCRREESSCPEPYSQCNLGKYGMINVHLVPHTHDDVG